MRDPLHHAAVTHEYIGVVINDVQTRTVEFGGQHLFRNGHAHRVGHTLPQRTGGGLHSRRTTVFGMPGRLRMELPKALQLRHRKIVAGEIQHCVEQHGAVAVRNHKPVAIRPERVLRVVAQVAGPQCNRHFGHAHGHAGMAGIRFLHRIHGKCAYGIGKIPRRDRC